MTKPTYELVMENRQCKRVEHRMKKRMKNAVLMCFFKAWQRRKAKWHAVTQANLFDDVKAWWQAKR